MVTLFGHMKVSIGYANVCHQSCPSNKTLASQVWYADDAAAGGSILQLRQWWDHHSSAGHHLGYFTNIKNTWLVVKKKHLAHAQGIIAGTGIEVTSEGYPYLGAALGSELLCTITQHSVLSGGLGIQVIDFFCPDSTPYFLLNIYSWFFIKIDIFSTHHP